LAIDHDGLIYAGAEGLAQAGDIGIDAVNHANGYRRVSWNLSARRGRRWGRLLREAGIAAPISITISIAVTIRIERTGANVLSRVLTDIRSRLAAEFQIPDVCNVECIHAIADRHANVARVATQVLAIDDPAAAQSERVGGANSGYSQNDRSEAK
jgi:hypothetical protein